MTVKTSRAGHDWNDTREVAFKSMVFPLPLYKLHLMSDLREDDGMMSWNGSLVKTFQQKPWECSHPSTNGRLIPVFPHFSHKHLLMPLNQMSSGAQLFS